MSGRPTRPVLRWHGGKWRLAPWILAHLPPHRVYVEPFCGAASVLLRKPRSHAEVIGDLDGDVVNLFEVLRSDNAAALIRAVTLTPFAEAEYRAAYEPADCPVERARRLIVRSFMGFGSNSPVRRSGFRSNSNRSGTIPAVEWATSYPAALAAVAERLRGVVIQHRDAMSVMAGHDSPDTVHYVDPPYLPETRDAGADYRHEMSPGDHAVLLEFLQTLKGTVLLSGYASPTYEAALYGWHRVECRALADGARPRTEVLWINRRSADLLEALT